MSLHVASQEDAKPGERCLVNHVQRKVLQFTTRKAGAMKWRQCCDVENGIAVSRTDSVCLSLHKISLMATLAIGCERDLPCRGVDCLQRLAVVAEAHTCRKDTSVARSLLGSCPARELQAASLATQ